jgi:3-oxoadipate enol-lactonase
MQLYYEEGSIMPLAKVNNIALYYEMHGAGGTPLVMIAGGGDSKADWLPEHLALLCTKHQVVIFDNRGIGQSDKPTEPYSMAQYAADIIGLLDELSIDCTHIFGVSMGGMIAQHVAINYPRRLLSLVLACTIPGGLSHPKVVPPTEAVLAQLDKPSSSNPAQDIRDGWSIVYAPHFIENNSAFLERILQAHLAYPEPPAYANNLRWEAIVKTHDTYADLPHIRCPTLILTGTEDRLVPAENSQLMAARIPNARLIQYPGCAHGFLHETGTKAIEDVLAFLEEVDQAQLDC